MKGAVWSNARSNSNEIIDECLFMISWLIYISQLIDNEAKSSKDYREGEIYATHFIIL